MDPYHIIAQLQAVIEEQRADLERVAEKHARERKHTRYEYMVNNKVFDDYEEAAFESSMVGEILYVKKIVDMPWEEMPLAPFEDIKDN